MQNRSIKALALVVGLFGIAVTQTARAADGPANVVTSPAGRTVLQGSPTTFTVTADGTAPLSYQWRKDGAAIAGATSASLTIGGAQPSDEGNYSVLVSNALGTATSAPAEFLVDPGIITGTLNTNLFGYAYSWKYNQSGADLGTAWLATAFDDSSWSSGPGIFGLETTALPDTIRTPLALGSPQVITYYFRTHFNLPAAAAGATLVSTNVLDDGAVFHLNGSTVGRMRVAEGQTSQTLADNQGTEGVAEEIPLQNTGLVVGDNVMAVEVHQSATTSSDVVFGMALTATVPIRSADNVRPTILSASSPTSSVVLVSFSERIEPATATNSSNYTLNNSATVTAAYFTNDNRTIALATSPIAEGASYTLTVSNIRDRAVTPNTILANSTFSFVRASGAFASQDIGAPSVAGIVSAVPGGYNITAGGTNIVGTADQFSFNYQQVVGDFDFKVRVAGLTLADAWSKAGLMARESLIANSRYGASFATPSGNGTYFQARTNAGIAPVNSGSYPANYPNTWLRLKRAGNLFTGFASVDGDAWYQLGSATIAMSANAYVGMAVSAGVTNGSAIATATAQFREFMPVVGGTVAIALPDIEPPGPSSRRTPIAITEIHYNPPPDAQSNVLEFIEIYNSNPYFEDISGWRISGDIDFTFPANTTLRAGEYRVIARNPAHVMAVYGLAASTVMGPYSNTLTEASTLRLRNKEDAVLLEIEYNNQPPWPAAADSAGHSLVLARPSYGEGSPLAWSASDQVGGSPGRYDNYSFSPQRAVVINEFLANSTATDFIELYNHSNVEVDLSGCTLSDDPHTNKFVMPPNTKIQPRGFLSFDQSQLGFGLSSGGETVYFRSADGKRVLDAVRFEAQATDVPSGRYPDGAKEIYPLTTSTAGAANAPIRIHDIVINEIMFKPISDRNEDEYVELYNKGASAVNLSNWRFVAGIDFKFPSNTVLAADSYLVVAKNASRLLTNYPNLTTNNTYGDYGGSLGNSGDRIALARPDVSITTNGAVIRTNTVYVVVDEVTYGPGGQWGNWASEGGSSLELVDPRANHRLAYNWADSDETAKAPWTTIEATDLLNNGAGTANFFEVLALGEGEYLVDNVEVIGVGGTNILTQANSTFESGQGGWQFRGTHIASTVDTTGGFGGGRCLHMRTSARGDSIHNRCLVSIPSLATPGPATTLRMKVRWLRGWPEILCRVHGNWIEATGRLALPPNLGTPGARNSQAASNTAPAIYAVSHAPVVPAANQAVIVTASAQDPDGIGSMTLRYRLDPATSYTPVAMNDAGTGGDEIAGDGIYSATIPGQSAGAMIAYYVQATDAAVSPLSAIYPRGASPTTYECLVRFGDPTPASGFGTYRQWMTSYQFSTYANRPALSNERIPVTFVYGNFRAIHFAAVKWAGSPYHQFGGDPNTTGHYSFDLPRDDIFLGTENLNKVHGPGNGAFDDTYIQREQTCYWFARQLGLPWNYRRCINMYFNGVRPGGANQLMEDTETPGSDVVSSRFSDDPDGDLYKLQPWFEVDDGTARSLGFANQSWCQLTKFTTTSNSVPVHKLARYRHNYLARAVKGSANDYANVFALIDAADTPAGPSHTANMLGIAEMEQWMRTFAVHHSVGDWDHFGSRNSQNMYGYVSANTKWSLMIWDMNIVIGNGSSAQGQNLFEITGGGANMQKIYDNPTFRRMYLRALKELCNGAFLSANMDPVVDSKYAAYLASGVAPTAPAGIKSWMATARTAILGVVASEDAATFRLTSTNSVVTETNLVTITGEAPVEARIILVNGVEYAITWSNVKTFTIRVPVSEASSVLSLRGYDINGLPIAAISTNIPVTYTGPLPSAETSLVINEIMYNPVQPDASYIEIFNNSSFAFDLSGWRVNGIDFTFGTGNYIAGRQYLILAKNRPAYTAAYPGAVAPYGQFNGSLDNGGETITLQRPVTVLTTNGAVVTTNIVFVAVDKVHYDDDLPWPGGADGFGPSLQLIDATQDNARSANWADSEDWRYITYTGTIAGGASPGTNWLVFLNGAGDVYIDDMVLVTGTQPEVGPNLISNGGFETPFGSVWTNLGNHSNSVISTELSHSGSASLHIIATGSGGSTAAMRQFLPALPVTTNCTLSFWMKPSTNGSVLSMRTTPGSAFVSTNGIRPVLFSPGVANSVAVPQTPYDPLWLNELQANNLTGIVDNQGEREPWIELYNSGATPLELGGYYLADNYTNNLTQWPLPSGTLAPGAFKIIWADGQPGQSTATQWHTSFRLNSQTGSVALVRVISGKPQITDYLNYSNLREDLSYGDFPNGQPAERQTFFSPTPGTLNQGREINVFINEWMAANTNTLADPADGDFDDWFELYNPGATPVDLGGYWLTDNLNAPQGFQIPNNGQYIIPAGGFLLVWADGETGQNSDSRIDLHASFQLAREGESIGLFAPNGSTLIDGVTFGPQTNNISEGRFADGAATRYFMTTPTPRGPNTIGGGGNTAPAINPVADRTITLGQTVSFTVSATDAEAPPQTLAFSLDAGFPAGASINGTSGLFTWTPSTLQAPSVNPVTVRVNDNGAPALSSTRTFTITVRMPPRATITIDGSGHVTLGFATESGKTYRVDYKDNLNNPNWLPLGAAIMANSGTLTVPDDIGGNPQRFYRIVQLD